MGVEPSASSRWRKKTPSESSFSPSSVHKQQFGGGVWRGGTVVAARVFSGANSEVDPGVETHAYACAAYEARAAGIKHNEAFHLRAEMFLHF